MNGLIRNCTYEFFSPLLFSKNCFFPLLILALFPVLSGCGKRLQINNTLAPPPQTGSPINHDDKPANTPLPPCSTLLSGSLVRHEPSLNTFNSNDPVLWEVKASGACASDYVALFPGTGVLRLSKQPYLITSYVPGIYVQKVYIMALNAQGSVTEQTEIQSSPFTVHEAPVNTLSCSVTVDPSSIEVVEDASGNIQGTQPIFTFTVVVNKNGQIITSQVNTVDSRGGGQLCDEIPSPTAQSHSLKYSAQKTGQHALTFHASNPTDPNSHTSCMASINIVGRPQSATPASLTSITITPATSSIALGLTQQFIATGHYSDNSSLTITGEVTWESSNSAIAEISNTAGSKGIILSKSEGSSSITASLGGVSATASLTIRQPELISISLSPQNVALNPNQTQQYIATGTYTNQSTSVITSSVSWSSSNIAVATINNTGLLTAASIGSTIVMATQGSLSANVNLSITAPTIVSLQISPSNNLIGLEKWRQLSATATYSDNSTSDISSSVEWTSLYPSKVKVGNTASVGTSASDKGIITGVSLGNSQITASYSGKTGTLDITVDVLETYVFYTRQGNFDKTLNEINGTDHDFVNFNFKTRKFKLYINERLLSRINYAGVNSYTASDISHTENKHAFAEITSINRSSAERTAAAYQNNNRCTAIPDSVFGPARVDNSTMLSGGNYLDLSSKSSPTYIFSDENRDRWATSSQGCFPSIHSSRVERFASFEATPSFSGCPAWCDCSRGATMSRCNHYSNTYGNGAYIYVDSSGQLHLKYKVSRIQSSRAVFVIGILSNDL